MAPRISFGLVLVALSLVGCDEPKATPAASSAAASATAVATTSATAAPVGPSASATSIACDVPIAPGERIGDKPLAGSTSLRVDVEPAKSYCVFGVRLTAKSSIADVRAAAPKTCKEVALLGGTHLECEDEGVALSFGGPTLLFDHVTVYPKGKSPQAPSSGAPSARPPASAK